MHRKIRFLMLILATGAAAPALAIGVRIDPDGAPAAASTSPAQVVAQLMGYNGADIGGALDPNG
jgi:hypothetical protein